MKNLNSQIFKAAIAQVNESGFAAIDLKESLPPELGEKLYLAMNQIDFHPQRKNYYNEVAFYWPEDWTDVPEGIGAFHEQKSLKHIYTQTQAYEIFRERFDEDLTQSIINFGSAIKKLIVSNHHGLPNNKLKLSRLMVRQMGDSDKTLHGASEYHEDFGYQDRPYRQLLSAIITTHGLTTISSQHQSKLTELLIFNAYDRRKILGLGDELAFMHKGPSTGPKMFFFFEFLGPRE